MKLTYLGTGAAEGIPAVFCNCEYCKSVRESGKGIRSRSQILIDGDLSLDFPPDAFYHQALRNADLSAVRYLLVTHSHMDHFSACDFVLRGYKYARSMTAPSLDIFANAEVCEVFTETTRRELRPEIGETIRLHPLGAFETVSFGKYCVHTLQAKHSSRNPLLFLIEKEGKRVLHLHDTGPLPEEDYGFLAQIGGKAVDLVNFDCTFLWDCANGSARHMGLSDNAAVFRRLEEIGLADGHTKKVVTHFSHNNRPTEESLRRAEEEFGCLAAYDGMELEI